MSMFEAEFPAGPLTLSALDNRGEGKVIIGLHGFLDNAASLEPLAESFKEYRFIALDLAGHGRSSHRPHGAHYNQLDYVQDLYALIQQQEFQRVILVGHSLGGIVASLYAAVFPEQVEAVISIDACGPLTSPVETTPQQIHDSILSRHNKSRNRLNIVDVSQAVAARCEISDIHPEHAEQIILRNLTQDASGHCFWASDPRLRTRSNLRFTEDQAEALMRNIVCPVWIAAASDSFKKVSEIFDQRHDWFRQAECEQFSGGHHVHMERPDAVGQAAREFLERL